MSIEVAYRPYPPVVLKDPSQDPLKADFRRDYVTARQRAEDEATKQLKQRMDEIDSKYLGRGYTHRDTQPALHAHVHWLYLRVCPQQDIGRPWGWQKIADAVGFSKTTVRDAVLALVHELGITLPKLPPGQPARFA